MRTKEPNVLSAPSPGPVLCEEDCFKMFLVSLLSDGGTIKDKSPTFSVSGVKGNLSYKITNTFITHLTETTVNTISVKRFLKRQEFCIFSRVGSRCLLLRV